MSNQTLTWNQLAAADQHVFDPLTVFKAGLRHHHIANTAYPIHHSTTMRPYRVPTVSTVPTGSPAEETAVAAWQGADRLGLYVHIPFCATRCKYCEYTVVALVPYSGMV